MDVKHVTHPIKVVKKTKQFVGVLSQHTTKAGHYVIILPE